MQMAISHVSGVTDLLHFILCGISVLPAYNIYIHICVYIIYIHKCVYGVYTYIYICTMCMSGAPRAEENAGFP